MAENYITEVDILDEAKDNFLTYANEVLTDRSIPSAEDGLLSAQRKLIWTMEDYLKMNASSKTKKCNAVIGSTLSTSYVHGDQACYGVLCKMSQPFLMRYPLIQGQGSLGTQENNDLVASSRYTEARPSEYADLMMLNYDKDVVPKKETYNGEFMEPVILPGLFPNALCNGRQAIGLSMSHSSAPMNLTEVCDGIIAYIKNPQITLDEMMGYIKGPDFPLGGTVINKNDIKAAFKTGHSERSLRVRGDYIIEGQDIIFTSIPYRTYRNKIKEQINKNIDIFSELLTDFSDESGTGQNRLVFRLKKDVSPQTVLSKLFALTDLQTTISYNMNFIVDGTPKLCSLLDLIQSYVQHQEEVLLRKTEFDKKKASKRKHVLDGLIIAIEDIDTAIDLIKESANKIEAAAKLVKHFNITEKQAEAILNMKLARLTKLDKDELLKELKEKIAIIAECDKIIGDKAYRDETLIQIITEMRNKYGDARRTKLIQLEEPIETKEVIQVVPEKCVVVLTESGSIKRIPSKSFREQKPNGKGIKAQADITSMVLRTNTVDSLMIFTNKGKMYRLLVDDIPTGTNSSQGTPIRNLISLEPNEEPNVIYSIYKDTDAKYVLFVTKKGKVKKTSLDEYIKTKKKTGIGAITISEDDELATVSLIKDELLTIITSKGYSLTFDSKEIGASSRLTQGIKGINLGANDFVVAALPVRNKNDSLAVFSQNGLSKKIPPKDQVIQKRGGRGVICYKPTAETGPVVSACLVSDEDDILVMGNQSSIRIAATKIPSLGRNSQGNKIIKGNNIVSVSKI